jgi:hypothetical protein
VALLIATGDYADPLLRRLRAPTRDVSALAEVLSDPAIGDFTVRTVVNQGRQNVEEAIEDAFAARKPGDIVLVYFSCHGIKDLHGRLYFAASNSRHDRLASTAISSAFVNEQMERSRANAKVALLDCCYSGAFAKGLAPKSGPTGDLANQICGKGSYVITATNALEYAYEDAHIVDESAESSVFTDVLVHGLRTGSADWDGDGQVSPEDLYWYLDKQFRSTGRPQTPTSFSSGVQGTVAIARAPGHPQRNAHDTQSAAAEVQRHLRDLEVRYASIREVLPSGGRRTALLDDIAAQASAIWVRAQQLGLITPRVASFAHDDDAARIITLALCGRIEHPDTAVTAAIVDGIRHSRSAFEQYWALLSATSVVNYLPQESLSSLREAAQEVMDSITTPENSNRASLARQLLANTSPDHET